MTATQARGLTLVQAKALRYLAAGRVTVHQADALRVRVTVQGGAPYVIRWTRRDGWRCDCPARALCAHLVAAQLVTARDVSPQAEGVAHGG